MALRASNNKYNVITSKYLDASIMEDEEHVPTETTELLDSENEDDYIVKCIGAFGPWQGSVCIIAASTRFVAIWNMLSIIFLTPVTEFSCIKFEDNASVVALNSTCYNNCLVYEFYEDIFDKTLISEFVLVCDDAWKGSFTQTMLMFGFLLGVWLFGWVSDRYGRRTGLMISAFTNLSFMLVTPFSPNYWVFNWFRFFVGMSSGGTMIISLVFIIEVVGPNYREAAGSLAILPDGIAEATLAVFAYLSLNWRVYLFEYSVAAFFIYILIPFLPESPRWLMSKGKTGEAIDVMTKAAYKNKIDPVHIQNNVFSALEEMLMNYSEIRKSNYGDLFKTKELAFNTVASIIIWTSCGVCYFGINQYITFIGSNIYFTVILLGAVQTPTCLLAMVLNKTYGRRATTISTLAVIGSTMAILIFTPPGHTGCTVLGIIGFAATCTTFSVLCLYVSELFPTPLRTMAYGLSSGGSKIGAMVAPFIATINPHWIPSLIFTVLPFIASAFCILLPETKGRKLQDIF